VPPGTNPYFPQTTVVTFNTIKVDMVISEYLPYRDGRSPGGASMERVTCNLTYCHNIPAFYFVCQGSRDQQVSNYSSYISFSFVWAVIIQVTDIYL